MNIKQFFMDNYNYVKSEVFVFLAALVTPTTPMLILIGLLIMSDTITGIYAGVKVKGWGGFKSRLMSNGLLPKLIFYPLAILIAQAMESQYPIIPVMKTTGFLLMSIEAKSIGENYKVIFGVSIFGSLRAMMSKGDREALYASFKNNDNKGDA